VTGELLFLHVFLRAIESISEGRRQAESRFPGMCVAAQGQRSVTSMFGTKVPSRTKK
jgi:hypothetical protein